MVRMLLLVVVCIGLLPIQMRAQKNSYIIPGEVWKDTDGNPINAHGGGLLYHDGTYYWYGEYKKGKTILPDWATWECYRTDVTGVGCYSSKDLLNWKFEGIVLPAVKEGPNHDLHPSKVLERPKVIYNKKTGKFVMWAHVESADYSKACAGVAVSDFPNGPFTYLGSFRPNNAMSRDQTVFVDDDGRAYQFYSSDKQQIPVCQRVKFRISNISFVHSGHRHFIAQFQRTGGDTAAVIQLMSMVVKRNVQIPFSVHHYTDDIVGIFYISTILSTMQCPLLRI